MRIESASRVARRAAALAAAALAACSSTPPRPSEAETARGRELARRLIVLDGHIDVPYRLNAHPEDVTQRTPGGDFDVPRAFEGGLDAPFFSIYVPAEKEETGGAKAMADALIDGVDAMVARAPDRLALARTAADVRREAAAGRLAILLGMENGSPMERDLANVDHFFRRGVRYVTLCHSKDNHLCDSSYDARRTWKGLSPFGRDVVRRMNDLGMMVDVSHVSDDAFFAVMEASRAPVIASHSSCREFTPGFERNMSDDMIRRLAARGGVIQINFGSAFLRDDVRRRSERVYERFGKIVAERKIASDGPEAMEIQKRLFEEAAPGFADVRDVADHIDHVVRLVGADFVGLGSDFDGVGDSLPTGLKDVSMYPNLLAELLRRGYSEGDLEKICSGNVLRVMEAVERIARETPASAR